MENMALVVLFALVPSKEEVAFLAVWDNLALVAGDNSVKESVLMGIAGFVHSVVGEVATEDNFLLPAALEKPIMAVQHFLKCYKMKLVHQLQQLKNYVLLRKHK